MWLKAPKNRKSAQLQFTSQDESKKEVNKKEGKSFIQNNFPPSSTP